MSLAKSGIALTGFEELDRKLREMPPAMRKKALRSACRDVAKFVRQLALREVPRRTGALAKSLVVRAAKRSQKYKHQVAVTVRTKDGFFQGDEFYGGMVEFGTADRRTRSGAYRGRVPETKFLRNALYSFPDRKRRMFQAAVRRWLDEQGRKGATR